MTAVTPGPTLGRTAPLPLEYAFERLIDRIPFLEKEMLLLRRLVQPGWTCVDVGAAGGTYLHLLSRTVGPAGRVVGVEPRRRSAAHLRRLGRWLGWDNVTIYRVALADVAGRAVLSVPRWVRTEAHLLPATDADSPGTTEQVLQWTLDGLVDRAGLQRLDLVKCDVEGAEELVFAGATETLRRWSPIVICEVERRHVARYGRRPGQVIERFRAHGYRTYRYGQGRLRPVTHVDEGENDYVFLPPEPAVGAVGALSA